MMKNKTKKENIVTGYMPVKLKDLSDIEREDLHNYLTQKLLEGIEKFLLGIDKDAEKYYDKGGEK